MIKAGRNCLKRIDFCRKVPKVCVLDKSYVTVLVRNIQMVKMTNPPPHPPDCPPKPPPPQLNRDTISSLTLIRLDTESGFHSGQFSGNVLLFLKSYVTVLVRNIQMAKMTNPPPHPPDCPPKPPPPPPQLNRDTISSLTLIRLDTESGFHSGQFSGNVLLFLVGSLKCFALAFCRNKCFKYVRDCF